MEAWQKRQQSSVPTYRTFISRSWTCWSAVVGRAGGTSPPQRRIFRAVLDVFAIANLAVDQQDMPITGVNWSTIGADRRAPY
jgi:hypothetical protein